MARRNITGLLAFSLSLLVFPCSTLSSLAESGSGSAKAQEFETSGKAKLANKDYDGAIDDFSQAIKADPKDSSAFCSRGIAYFEQGQAIKAIPDFDQAIKLDSKNAMAFSNRGLAYGQLGQHDKAVQDFTKAIELRPQRALYYFNRGTAYSGMHDSSSALADLDKAIELDPQQGRYYYNRSVARENAGDLVGAQADYDKAVQKDQSLDKMPRPKGSSVAQTQTPQTDASQKKHVNSEAARNASALSAKGWNMSKTGDYRGALPVYEKALLLNSEDDVIYAHRAWAYQKLNELKSAVEDYDKAIKLNPNNPRYYLNRAWCRRDPDQKQQPADQLRLSLEDLNKALELNPEYALAYTNRGFVKDELGDTSGAIADYQKALAINPSDAKTQELANAAQHNSGSGSSNTISRPNGSHMSFQSINNEAVQDMNAKRFQEAISKLESILKVAPDYKYARENLGVAHNNYGLQLQSQGKSPEAASEFRKALYYTPDNQVNHQNLSACLQSQGKDPKSFDERVNLSKQLESKGDLMGAYAECIAAQHIHPDSALKKHSDDLSNAIRSASGAGVVAALPQSASPSTSTSRSSSTSSAASSSSTLGSQTPSSKSNSVSKSASSETPLDSKKASPDALDPSKQQNSDGDSAGDTANAPASTEQNSDSASGSTTRSSSHHHRSSERKQSDFSKGSDRERRASSASSGAGASTTDQDHKGSDAASSSDSKISIASKDSDSERKVSTAGSTSTAGSASDSSAKPGTASGGGDHIGDTPPPTFGADKAAIATWESSMSRGNQAFAAKEYATAAKEYSAAVDQARQFGPQNFRLATSLEKLGNTYTAQRNYGLAEPVIFELISLRENTLGPGHPELARVLNSYADILRHTDRQEEAEKYATRAREVTSQAGAQ